MRTYLEVPYADKDRAKALGARFDMSRKQWYCPDGVDLTPLKRWLGRNTTAEKIARLQKELARKRRAEAA